MKANSPSLLSALLLSLAAGSLGAAPAIYEPFDYETGLNVSGLDGGTGFTGAWQSTRNNPTVAAPDRTWGDLPTAGGYARGAAWSGLVRPIGSTLADAGLLNNGATLWFSVVMDLESQNTTNADLNLALCSSQFVPNVFGDREKLESGEGIGVTHSRAVVQGVYWQPGGVREENNSTTTINPDNGTRALIVGKIDWGAGDTDSETLTLFAPASDLEMGVPTMEAWSEIPALDQSQFDTLALQFKDQSQFDEIRFGASYEDVTGGDGPPAENFAITAIEYDEDNQSVTLTWPDTGGSYIAKLSPDMSNWDSDMGDDLSSADDENPEDPTTITVTFQLSGLPMAEGPALFFRIEEG